MSDNSVCSLRGSVGCAEDEVYREKAKRSRKTVKGNRRGSRAKEGRAQPSPWARAGLRRSVRVHGAAKPTPNQQSEKKKAKDKVA